MEQMPTISVAKALKETPSRFKIVGFVDKNSKTSLKEC
jgi:hypothetical protein